MALGVCGLARWYSLCALLGGRTSTRSWMASSRRSRFPPGEDPESASAGWLGMMVATDGNTRTTAACAGKEVKDSQGKVTGGTGSLNDGLRVAFKAGSVMGFVVVGLGLVGLAASASWRRTRAWARRSRCRFWRVLASARRRSRCSRASRAASTRRAPTSVPTSSARSRRASTRTTRTTRP